MYTMTTNSSLAIVMEGIEQVLSLRAKVAVDKRRIKHMAWHESFNDWSKLQVRLPGTYLPSWIMAGSYWNEDGWDFVLARRPKGMTQPVLHGVLVVRTDTLKYRRIIVQMSKQRADTIIRWWHEEA